MPIRDIAAAIPQVGTLARIVDDVEQERVVADLEVFEIAVAHRALRVGLVAPEQLPRPRIALFPVSIGSRLMPSGG